MTDFPELFEGHHEFLLHEILNSIDDAVVVFNQRQEVVYANPAAKEVFGKDLLDTSTSSIVPEDVRAQFNHMVTELRDSEDRSVELKQGREFVGLRDNGHSFYASGRLTKLQGELSYVLILRDITWKKALEDELESALLHLRAVGSRVESRLEHPRVTDDFPPE